MISGLPPDSHTVEALRNDPDVQRETITREEADPASAPSPDDWEPAIRDWSLTHELLAALIEAVWALSAGEDEPPTFPRPSDPLDQVRAMRATQFTREKFTELGIPF